MTKKDVTIVGAGMMGLALALGLARNNFSVCVIDAKTLKENTGTDEYDLRVSAITPNTKTFLQELQVWEQILSMRASLFHKMSVYNDDGAIHFDAQQLQESALGWIIENSIIQTALYRALKDYPQVTFVASAQIEHLNISEKGAEIFIEAQETLSSQLLVAADGANSWVRRHLDIPIKTWSYEQSAIVANVQCSKGHQQTAWQRFLPTGPLAFLPLNQDNLCAIVWSCQTEKANTCLALSDDAFNQAITPHLSSYLGDINLVSKRVSFPLMMRHIAHYVQPSLAFIGDAAHTIHPLAGQGANCGFKDVMKLLQVINLAKEKNHSLGTYALLRKYERERKTDNAQMIMLMEGFHRLFTNEHTVVSLLRNQGLNLTNKLSPLKHKMIKYALGLQ